MGKAHWLRRAASPWLRAGAFSFVMAASAFAATAQDGPVLSDPVELLDFDAPESWAMKYFSSASLLTGLGPVLARRAGEIELALEGIWVPSLSEDQRRVGFGGFKVEDLNRSELFGRARAAFGVGARTSVVVGVVPPLEVEGLEATLLALAVERPFFELEHWSAGWRVFGQAGEAKGDLTCTEADARFPAGSPGNLFGCLAPSRDEVSLDHLGLELKVGYRVTELWTLHAGAAVVDHDLAFQVDALTYDIHDRTLQLAEGTTLAATFGALWKLGGRFSLSVEGLYTPLDRRRLRSPDTPTIGDELLHVRGVLRWRIRR
ncbi:MAG TPA: hypothetical protein VNB06_07900 [Thermoanaerobaculia bacterium]|nr:hypothetical protein [Thermoanaerobaculia bacterium]